MIFFFAVGEEARVRPEPVLSDLLMTINGVVIGSKFRSIHSTLA